MKTAPTRAHHQVTFAVLTLGVAAFALLQSLMMPVLATVEKVLDTNQTNVTWVLTAYLLSASIFTPIMGRLGDMYGKKRLFVIAMVALAVGSMLAALATSLAVMIVARAIQGIGGGVLPLAFGIIRDEFPKTKVPGAIGLIAALISVGGGSGTVLAGPIVELLGYRWLFWIPLIITSLAGLAAFFMVPESAVRSVGKINWLTAFLLSAWLVALLLAVSQAPKWGWGSPKVIGMALVAAAIAAAWIVIESRSSNPLIDMKMMRIRSVWAANLVALLTGIGMYAGLAFLPQLVQTPSAAGYGFGASVTQSGLMMLPSAIGMLTVGLFAGRLAVRYGSKNLLIAGSIVSAASFFIIAFQHSSEIDIYVAMAVNGIGSGLAFAAMANVVVAAVPPSQTGVATGMNANIRTIGGSLGAAFMASVVAMDVSPSGMPTESGYTNGFTMLGIAGVLAACAALFIPAMKRDPKTHLEDSAELSHPELAMVAGGTLAGDKSE